MTSLRAARFTSIGCALFALTLGACALRPHPPAKLEAVVQEIGALRPASLQEGRRLRAVATTSLVAETVAIVGDEDIDLTALLPQGVDPHTYEPTPQDLRVVAEADLVFINGLGLEEFLAQLLVNAGGQAAWVSLSEGIEARQLTAEGGVDPHVWMDPANVSTWAENAARALGALDPAHLADYEARAAHYQVELRSLDAWIQQQVGQIPRSRRRLVSDHDELGYFADRYGFEVVGAVIPAYSTSAEPSAQEVSQLEQAIRDLGVRAVFVSAAVNPTLAARVAEDTGVQLVSLYTHSIGPPGAAGTYLTLMEYNVHAIVQALQ